VHRGLAQPAGMRGPGGSIGRNGAVPVRPVREIAVVRDALVENDLGTLPSPIGGRTIVPVRRRPSAVDVRPPDGDEGAVPAPLVRVQVRRRLGPATAIVAPQDVDRSRPQPFVVQVHLSCRPLVADRPISPYLQLSERPASPTVRRLGSTGDRVAQQPGTLGEDLAAHFDIVCRGLRVGG